MGVQVRAALRLTFVISVLTVVTCAAQLARYDGFVAPAGYNFGPANVAICQAGGSGGPPCSPLALVYADATGKYQISQPFPADINGRYYFYAPAGAYVTNTYGSGYTTTLTTVTVGNAAQLPALKPFPSEAIQYVAVGGNDGNDGLSWGTAKKTAAGACAALPGGNSSCSAGNGVIYFGPNVNTASLTFTGSNITPVQFGETSCGTNLPGLCVASTSNFQSSLWLFPINGNSGFSIALTTDANGQPSVVSDGATIAIDPASDANGQVIFRGQGVAANNSSGLNAPIGFNPIGQTNVNGVFAANQWATTLTLAAGTATFTFPITYTSTPVCVLGPSVTGNTYKVVPSTTNAIVTSSSGTDTSTIGVACFGNPN